jgi:hypothetical protein
LVPHKREDKSNAEQPASPPSPKGKSAPHPSHGSATTSETLQPSRSDTTETTPTSVHVWDGICPSAAGQSDAREPAVSEITRRYAANSEPTVLDKGCMSHIYPKHFHGEFYATMTGIEPETLNPLSLCVDSEAFGTTVFLAAISAEIEQLVTEVGPVGGPPVARGFFPRYPVGTDGEMYLADSRGGIYLFVRRSASEHWVKLVPTLARALLGAMNGFDHLWLWPSQPRRERNGEESVALRLEPGAAPVAHISLRADGVATDGNVPYRPHWTSEPKRKATRREDLSVSELEERALTAR